MTMKLLSSDSVLSAWPQALNLNPLRLSPVAICASLLADWMERIILSFCSLIQDERDLFCGSSHSWELKHYSQNISPENWTQDAQTQERGHSEWMAQCLGRNWREEKVLKMRVMSLRLLISLEDIRWRLFKFTDQDWAQTQHGKSKNIWIKRLFPEVVVPFISLLILGKP